MKGKGWKATALPINVSRLAGQALDINDSEEICGYMDLLGFDGPNRAPCVWIQKREVASTGSGPFYRYPITLWVDVLSPSIVELPSSGTTMIPRIDPLPAIGNVKIPNSNLSILKPQASQEGLTTSVSS